LLRYFRINDPYRLVIIFFLLLIVRLPFIFSDGLITVQELKWMVIGEKLSAGGPMYVSVWDHTGPLSSLLYWCLHELFGRSHLAYQWLGFLVFFFQAAYFNTFLIQRKAYNENSYVPALIYILLGQLIFDTMYPSPELLGMTFWLMAANSLFAHLETRQKNDVNLLNIGIFSGIASLFFLPYVLFLIAFALGLLFYTTTIPRRYLLLIYGVFFVFLLLWMFYYLGGHSEELQVAFFTGLFKSETYQFLDSRSIIAIIVVPALLVMWGILSVLNYPSYINYQVRIQSIFLIYLVIGTLGWFVYSAHSGSYFIIFVPAAAFFLTHFFLLIRRALKREGIFAGFAVVMLLMLYGPVFSIFGLNRLVDVQTLLLPDAGSMPNRPDDRLLVLGQDMVPYQQARLATPYLDWQLSSLQLGRLNYYDNLIAIHDHFLADKPQRIIDHHNIMEGVFEKIPQLQSMYIKRSADPAVYVLRSPE
jgi:hypothetical protein